MLNHFLCICYVETDVISWCHTPAPAPTPSSYRVFCMMGDGESAEGSIWEAASFSSYYKLDNLVAILDVNRLGQSQPAALEHRTDVYQARMEAFGFNAIVVDGHDVEALCRAFYDAEQCKGKPTCLICKTYKGKGVWLVGVAFWSVGVVSQSDLTVLGFTVV